MTMANNDPFWVHAARTIFSIAAFKFKDKAPTTKKLLSIDDLKRTYKNLPNDCETIFQYIFPNSQVVQNIVNENRQLQLQNQFVVGWLSDINSPCVLIK